MSDKAQKPDAAAAQDDPWARWRKSQAAAAATPAPVVQQAAEAVVPEVAAEVPQKPSGTLGVRKTAGSDDAPRKRPVRGGALPRKPREMPASPRTSESGATPAPRSAAVKPRQEDPWRKRENPVRIRNPELVRARRIRVRRARRPVPAIRPLPPGALIFPGRQRNGKVLRPKTSALPRKVVCVCPR